MKKDRIKFRFDLGVSQLLPEWKALLSKEWLKEDIISGATVACIAIPLSLAIALASGVHPSVGLITAIIAGITCALFGGTPLAVSGPAAAMAVLVASVVQKQGTGGLLLVSLGCGVLQLLTGVFGFGKVVRFIPFPVIAGFTAGIGAIILIGQLPRVLGLPAPDQSHVAGVLTHILELIHQTHLSSLGLAFGTIGITFLLPRVLPKLPAPLIAVALPSLAVAAFGLDVDTIGTIPNTLPRPALPAFDGINFQNTVGSTVMVYFLASLETLLSSSAIDKLTRKGRHDPDQELIGQGLGNVFSSFFGGIPVTGVIARSALNVQAGAKSRRSAIVHSLVLILTVYLFAPWMGRIPTAVLAGVLVSVALKMLHPREFFQIWSSSRSESITYLVTFFVIVFVDLVAGVQAGVIAALILTAIRMGQLKANIHFFKSEGPTQVAFEGPLTFISTSKFDGIRSELSRMSSSEGIIIDFSGMTLLDASGGGNLVDLILYLVDEEIEFTAVGLSSHHREMLTSLDHSGKVAQVLGGRLIGSPDQSRKIPKKVFDRLIYGVTRFKREVELKYYDLFSKLADGQSPHTLFITCSDSRIDPNLITMTQPGELFIVRNVGNLIPLFGKDDTPAEGAAVEFAVHLLGVKEIVVCGHSGCGAMKTILDQNAFTEEQRKQMPSLLLWLQNVRHLKRRLSKTGDLQEAAQMNAVMQIENLKTYPVIQKKLKDGSIRLRAWFYDIGKSHLEEWDEKAGTFVHLGARGVELESNADDDVNSSRAD